MSKIDKSLPQIPRAPALAADMADLVRGFKGMFGAYRPELHYMRGPGPAWHAKHDPASEEAGEHFAPSILQARG